MILFPLMTTWMWFQVFKASPLPAFLPRRRGQQQPREPVATRSA